MNRFQRKWDIRAADPSDMESVQAVASINLDRKFEGIEFWISKTSKYPHLSLVAERGNHVLGWILGWPDRQNDETRLRFNVHVEPSSPGTALYRELTESLEESAKSSGAAQLRTSLFQEERQLLMALQSDGFLEHHRTLFSRLKLSEANITRAENGLARCKEQGFLLSETSLLGAEQSDFWQRLSAVHNTIMLSQNKDYDDPRPQFPTESVQAFIGGGQFPGLSGRMFVVHRGQDVVGYATVFHDGTGLHHGYTGVDPGYRRKGIALALKALIFRYARRHGVEYLDTGNRGDNLPVVSLNQSLGYKPEKIELHMWKHLNRPTFSS